jgi:hypothetical protein
MAHEAAADGGPPLHSLPLAAVPDRYHDLLRELAWHRVCSVCGRDFVPAGMLRGTRVCRAHPVEHDGGAYPCCQAESADAPGCTPSYHRWSEAPTAEGSVLYIPAVVAAALALHPESAHRARTDAPAAIRCSEFTVTDVADVGKYGAAVGAPPAPPAATSAWRTPVAAAEDVWFVPLCAHPSA